MNKLIMSGGAELYLPKRSESVEQQEIFQWAALLKSKYPKLRLLFHIPNGGLRNKATAGRLKAEGVKAGVPDLMLPVARGSYHGLFIELKAQGGRVSTLQKEWLNELKNEGYAALVCVGAEEAENAIRTYLEMGPFSMGPEKNIPSHWSGF